MGKLSVCEGLGGGGKKKKIHPNKINHDSLGREEEWGRGEGMGGGEYGANKAQFGLLIWSFFSLLRDTPMVLIICHDLVLVEAGSLICNYQTGAALQCLQ